MEPDIVWEDPPSSGLHHKRWAETLAPLRSRPGQWARVHGPSRYAATKAAQGRNGNWVGVDPSEFEIISRTIDGQSFIYARYVGNHVDVEE